jgi:hypothetical protein
MYIRKNINRDIRGIPQEIQWICYSDSKVIKSIRLGEIDYKKAQKAKQHQTKMKQYK